MIMIKPSEQLKRYAETFGSMNGFAKKAKIDVAAWFRLVNGKASAGGITIARINNNTDFHGRFHEAWDIVEEI